MDAFPAFFPLSGKTIVIVGEGESADAKARLFEGAPALVRRLTPAAGLDPSAYADACLAFIATEDDGLAEKAATAARQAGVPVNVVDRPALCDFTTPAVIDRGEVVVAIGTGGASPMLATMLRQSVEAQVPEGIGRLAVLFRQTQQAVREAFPQAHRRRTFLRGALSGPAARAALAGDMAAAEQLLIASLDEEHEPLGRVQYVDGAGPVDRVTLGALRALAAADVLISDPGVDAGVAALARRDAERRPPLPTPQLRRLTDEGLTVVRLVVGAAWRIELDDLRNAGVAADIRPMAS